MSAHPCPWTPTILDQIEPLLVDIGLPVHDPFAGTGERLGHLCDRLGLTFTGTEIEPEFIADPRVKPGDSTEADTYPDGPFVVVTSPVYPNGMTDHFHAQDRSRRHTYRQALAGILGHDRPLHPNNMGAYGNRYRRSQTIQNRHFELAAGCAEHWPEHVLVNVKNVVATDYSLDVVDLWWSLVEDSGYEVVAKLDVPTPGQRNGANRHLRADHETILHCQRHP